MQAIKTLPFRAFRMMVKPLIGTGIGRFRPIGAMYRYLAGTLLVPKEKRLVSVNNYKIYMHLEKNKGLDGIAQELIFKGNYEEYTTVLFKKFVKKGMTAVDIGANIGYFTLLFSTLVGEKGKVYAFEPEPRNYDLLVKNIKLNGFKNIIPLQKAVSNETGKIELFVDLLESGGHSIHQAAVQWGNESLTKPIPIDAASLDDVFKKEKRPIDIIKMDIQGAEPMALLGMKKTVEKSQDMKMITEFWPYGLQKSGASAKECWDLILRLGFKFIYRINDRNEKLEPADLPGLIRHCAGSMLRPPTSVNLLCTKTPLKK